MVVQEIRVNWTKDSRGGEGATRRNAVPEAAVIPLDRVERPDLRVVHHRLLFLERSGFVQPSEKVIVNPEDGPLRIGAVVIEWDGKEVCATFDWRRECGAPDRGWARKTMRVAANGWAQIVCNGRQSGWESGWWYEKVVVNAGLFSPPADDAFTQSEPAIRYSAMAHLF